MSKALTKEYLFGVYTSGKGMLPKGIRVGSVIATDKEDAYKKLAYQIPNPRLKDLINEGEIP